MNAIAASIALVLFVALLSPLRWRQIRGTTLVAPWVWLTISLASLTAAEVAVALAGAEQAWVPAARYAAAMSTFTPIMALLGAKRPQDRGWQWIVLTLWAILCQPSAEWLLFGGVDEIHPARFWFLMILVVVGATNGLGTRAWPASLLYCGGQAALLLPYLSTADVLSAGAAGFWGVLGVFAASAATTLIARFQRPATTNRLERVWLDFRDAFGVVWALRIQERMNASAAMYDWPLTLTWQGFRRRASAETGAAVPDLVEGSFRTLLRRFVSPEWIDERVAGVESDSQPDTVTLAR